MGLLFDELMCLKYSPRYPDCFTVLVDGFPRNMENMLTFQQAFSQVTNDNGEEKEVHPNGNQGSYFYPASLSAFLSISCSEDTMRSRVLHRSLSGETRTDDKLAIVNKRIHNWNDGTYNQLLQVLRNEQNHLASNNNPNPNHNHSHCSTQPLSHHFFEVSSEGPEDHVYGSVKQILQEVLATQDNHKAGSDKFQEKKEDELNHRLRYYEMASMPSYVYSYPIKGAFKSFTPSIDTLYGLGAKPKSDTGDSSENGNQATARPDPNNKYNGTNTTKKQIQQRNKYNNECRSHGNVRAESAGEEAREMVEKAWKDYKGELNVYVHVPYCLMKCSFCNLFTTMNFNEEKAEEYSDALINEIHLMATAFDPNLSSRTRDSESKEEGRKSEVLLPDVKVKTIHFGGGTPTLLPPRAIHKIISKIRQTFDTSHLQEIAIEGAPSSIRGASHLKELYDVGISRLSIGTQSFDKNELKSVSREHEIGKTEELVKQAKEIGFPNINIDIIYGLPHQTDDSFLSNVNKAISLGVHTLTLYCLAIRKKTKFGRLKNKTDKGSEHHTHRTAQQSGNLSDGDVDLTLLPKTKDRQDLNQTFEEPSKLYSLYNKASEILQEKGYTHKTLVLFGKGNRQEEAEFEGVPTLGLGAGARSYSPSVHYTSDHYPSPLLPSQVIRFYLFSVSQSLFPVLSFAHLNFDEQARRHVIMQLLYYQGVDVMNYRLRFGELLEQRFGQEIKVLMDNGLAEYNYHNDDNNLVNGMRTNVILRLSRKGMNYSSAVAHLLFSDDVVKVSTESDYY
eukprot:CAMPEP_0174267808 /NCGR_PEP_ID=MMETSP0439-20130205/34984_1 /TAXON_ID=0 /ORGANISM="Stereomyxa ramosa, Strain Chinc5" /LENGTH=786 /DNA_ID=CAMNT_0015355527 /DNA_START=366 /DNA_END=2726 /DNA_ORIENTATION=+